VQKSQSEAIKDLLNPQRINLHSFFNFDGGTFTANGYSRVAALSDNNNAVLNAFEAPVSFVPFSPFIKLVEPFFRQSVSNTDPNVKVR